ncbi:MAG TPA: hypothetical protein PKV21_09710, partial [bacterium]|nr:hypothetical protein [bacterium]
MLNMLPRYEFEQEVVREQANRYTKHFTAWQEVPGEFLCPDNREGKPAGYRDLVKDAAEELVSLGSGKCGAHSIWTAMIYCLLLAYIKYQTKYKYSLLYLTRVIKEYLLKRADII